MIWLDIIQAGNAVETSLLTFFVYAISNMMVNSKQIHIVFLAYDWAG